MLSDKVLLKSIRLSSSINETYDGAHYFCNTSQQQLFCSVHRFEPCDCIQPCDEKSKPTYELAKK